MRTTLDIDDDLLAAARELAQRERSTAGRVVSRLLRAALTEGPAGGPQVPDAQLPASTAGFRPFVSRGPTVSLADVERVRDEEGI